MDRQKMERCLGEIEAADSVRDVVAVVRSNLPELGDPAWSWSELRRAEDIGAAALEVAHVRMAMSIPDPRLEIVEAVLGRASVRVAELLDRTGGWRAFHARAAAPHSRMAE